MVECSSLAIRQPPVHLMISASDAVALTLKTTSPVHLIVSRSDAAVLISHSTASASDGIDIRCSFDIKINSLPAHNLIAASHSFDHFLMSLGTVDRPSYSFIWSNFPYKKTSIISTPIKDHLYTVRNTCSLSERPQRKRQSINIKTRFLCLSKWSF